jgi:hypothetical protein
MRAVHSELLLTYYDLTAATVAATGASPAEASRAWTIAWLAARRPQHTVRGSRAGLAAAVTALHDTLVVMAPDQAAELDAARDTALARLRGRRAMDWGARASARGVAAGALAASDTLADRADDGTLPGAWRPYLLRTLVAPDPLPADEPDPDEPDPPEAVVAFWAQPPLAVYTPAVRTALASLDAPLAARVDLVAVFHAVTTDALICGYAARDDEAAYPCRRAAFAGAAEIALTALAGQPAVPVRLDDRSYGDWRELTAECVDAAVCSGAHARPAALASAALGRRVAFKALSRWSGGSA